MRRMLLSALIALVVMSCVSHPPSEKQPAVVCGQITGLADTILTFTYTPYSFLAEDTTVSFEVDSTGNFTFNLADTVPGKGFFSFGKVPKTYEFSYQTVEGRDTIGIVPSVDFRMVWLYLEPGDSLQITADANAIESTLSFSGSGARNNEFVNQEEFRFNDYKSKFLRNYYYKTFLGPAEYQTKTMTLLLEKQNFLNQFDSEDQLSTFLKEVYQNDYLAETWASWIYYPDSHAGFNQGVYPEVPDQYWSFLDEIEPAQDLTQLGAGYLSFLNAWLSKRYELRNPSGENPVDLYSYMLESLPGESGYQLLAYKLQRDFNAGLYGYFGPDCPYPDLAARVKSKYQHLEAMFKGSVVPAVPLYTAEDELISLMDFRGKYLYLDFWATWCKPCIQEFPYLDAIKQQFADRNIVFIGVSVDREEDLQTWKNYVSENNLTGIQVHARRDGYEPLKKAWNIRSIPRFVIISPEGLMHEANSLRPSDPNLSGYLDELLK